MSCAGIVRTPRRQGETHGEGGNAGSGWMRSVAGERARGRGDCEQGRVVERTRGPRACDQSPTSKPITTIDILSHLLTLFIPLATSFAKFHNSGYSFDSKSNI